MPVKLKGATSGDVTLDVPAVAGTNTLTLPAKTGNLITSADTGTVTQTMLAAGLAGKVYIKSVTATGAAQLDLTGWYSSAFDVYEIEYFDMVPGTNNDDLRMRMSTDNGSTYDTGNNYSFNVQYGQLTTPGGVMTNLTSFVQIGGSRSNAANECSAGTIKLFHPASTKFKLVQAASTILAPSTLFIAGAYVAAAWKSTSAYNAVRLYFGTGTITGTARIYGLSKS